MFKEKDRVKHIYTGYVGTIRTIYPNDDIVVDYDNKNILPCKLGAHEYILLESKDTCPKCGNEWTEVLLFNTTVYDCLHCHIKKEDLNATSNADTTTKYESDWLHFKDVIENLAKDRCIITNKNWHKIREIHFKNYLGSIDNPFGFLFKLKYFYRTEYKHIKCAPKYYHKYKQERQRNITQWI